MRLDSVFIAAPNGERLIMAERSISVGTYHEFAYALNLFILEELDESFLRMIHTSYLPLD